MTLIAFKARQELDPSRQAAAQVFERLREMIVGLELVPGAVVNRLELQEGFGLSSTPIRDALMRLAEDDLVDIVPQSATRVSLIDIAKAHEAQFLRRAIELEAVTTLCTAPDKSVVGELKDIVAQQKELATRADFPAFDALDRRFHRRLYEAAGVGSLDALVRQRSGHVDRLRRLNLPVTGKMQEIIRDHAAITKAIAAGKTDEAQFRIRDHLSRSLGYSPALRERHPTYFKERP
jgi:DNA-binding GntR family transcriptional regulator